MCACVWQPVIERYQDVRYRVRDRMSVSMDGWSFDRLLIRDRSLISGRFCDPPVLVKVIISIKISP